MGSEQNSGGNAPKAQLSKFMRRGLLWAAAAFAAVLTAVTLREGRECINLDDNVRAAMKSERFAKLSDGVTHYQWQGPEGGHKVVLVHGFSSPYFIWDRTVPVLAQSGFRVLRLDLYGRGLSERLTTDYTGDVYDRQLLELLDVLGVKEPVDLVGLSMGGAIVTRFTDRHPERVRKMVLIGTAGVNTLPTAAKILSAPLVGDWLVKVFGDLIVTRAMPREVAKGAPGLAEAGAVYANQLQYRGYKRALVSTLRHGPLTGQEEAFSRVGRQDRKGMLLWGTNDTVVPYAVHKRVKELIPWLDFHAIEGGRHCVNYENADEVNSLLIAFLET
jgi:pimeloyl-ACP methyl ester carboxylesterase